MRVDEDAMESRSWQGIGGHCRLAIPRTALDHVDDVTYLTNNEEFDDLGRLLPIEPATMADWYRPTEPFRGFIPTAPEPGQAAEWFQALDCATPSELTSSGGWRIPAGHCAVMENDLTTFRDAVNTIAGHPKYDIHTWSPAEFDLADLQQEFSSPLELQVGGTHAKCSVLEMWAQLAWWISAIPDWNVDVPQEVVDRILAWNLLSRPCQKH
ncbi:hypothetical protein C8R46DRAFT_1245215 [Mycena filopes]|nr:hypothetical protein C8R46DRAFT_1245215 [Mycena filopes]